MSSKSPSGPRVAAIVGPYLSGKTSLLEAMLAQAGTVNRKGTVKEATLLSTPRRFFTDSRVTGIVALLLAVEKANNWAARILRKKIVGLSPPNSFNKML